MDARATKKGTLGMAGLVFGLFGLCAAVLHFWLGPIEPPPPIETVVAEQAVNIQKAVVAKLTGTTRRRQIY